MFLSFIYPAKSLAEIKSFFFQDLAEIHFKESFTKAG